jgi:hypothetical protein
LYIWKDISYEYPLHVKNEKNFMPLELLALLVFFSYSLCKKSCEKRNNHSLAVPKEKIPGKNEMAYFNVAHILKEINRKGKSIFVR